MKRLVLTLASALALAACPGPTRTVTVVEPCDAGLPATDGGSTERPPLPDGAIAPSDEPLESAALPSFPDRLPHSPYFSGSLAVPLSSLPMDAVLRAADHVYTVARDPDAEGDWADAKLLPQAVPLYRPDLDVPVAYELKLELANANAGFVVVSTERAGAPVAGYATLYPTRVEQLVERAAAQGASVARVYQLDPVHLVAEDASGAAVAAEPDDEYLKLVQNAAGGPMSFDVGTAADWPALKAQYAMAAQGWLDAQRTGFADGWVAEDRVAGRRAQQYGQLSNNLAAGILLPVPVRDFTVTYDVGGQRYVCHEVRAASPVPASLDQLTPAWNQIGNDFQHPNTGQTAMCASGCSPMAMAIVMGWMDRMGRYGRNPQWTRPDLRRAFFRYRDPVDPWTLTAPLADDSRYDYSAAAPFSWVGQSTAEPGPGTSPAMDMRRYLTEMSSALQTYCDGKSGATSFDGLPRVTRFLTGHRVPATVQAGSNPFGESGFRDNVIDRLQRHGAPGVINIDLSEGGHTVVVVASRLCDIEQQDTDGNWQKVGSTNPFLYANFGWGGANNHWMSVGNLKGSAVFDPVTSLVLDVNGSGRLAHASGSAVVTPAVAKAWSGNSFEYFADLLTFDPVGDGSQYVRSPTKNLCLNTGLSTAVGTAVTFAPCANGEYQRFTPWLMPNGQYMLYHHFSNHCLGAADDGDGAALQLKSCAPGDPNQRFTLD